MAGYKIQSVSTNNLLALAKSTIEGSRFGYWWTDRRNEAEQFLSRDAAERFIADHTEIRLDAVVIFYEWE